jgi:hypothetical protein
MAIADPVIPWRKVLRATIRDLNLRRRTHVSLADIAHQLNPLMRGTKLI